MDTINLTEGLFRDGQEEFARLAVKTYVGMAHLAGSGPAGMTCRECAFWKHRGTWAKADFVSQGEPHPAVCQRYKAFTFKRRGYAVPHDALACRHLELAENSQPLRRPEKAES